MPFEYSNIESEIVTRLSGKFPETYTVVALPEKEKGFQITKEDVLVVVAYSDSEFEKPTSVDVITQNEKVSVICNIKAMKLRGEGSVNEALRLLKQYLVGFKPSDLSKLYLSKIEFDERDAQENFFSYNVIFTGTKKNIEVPDEITDGPLLNEVFFREQVSITVS